MYLWSVDFPDLITGDIPDDGDRAVFRTLFNNRIDYASVPASGKLDWYYFSAVQNPVGETKLVSLPDFNALGDNQIGLTAGLNQGELSKFLTPTLTENPVISAPSLGNSAWSYPTILPIQIGLLGQISGGNLLSGSNKKTLIYFISEDVYVVNEFHVPDTLRRVIPLKEVQRQADVIAGKVTVSGSHRSRVPYDLKVLAAEKGATGKQALTVPVNPMP